MKAVFFFFNSIFWVAGCYALNDTQHDIERVKDWKPGYRFAVNITAEAGQSFKHLTLYTQSAFYKKCLTLPPKLWQKGTGIFLNQLLLNDPDSQMVKEGGGYQERQTKSLASPDSGVMRFFKIGTRGLIFIPLESLFTAGTLSLYPVAPIVPILYPSLKGGLYFSVASVSVTGQTILYPVTLIDRKECTHSKSGKNSALSSEKETAEKVIFTSADRL